MKKLSAIILALAMLFALAVQTAALTMENDSYDPETGEIIPGGVVIDNPYAELYAKFFTDGKYPDDFAGVWVENGGSFYVFALVEGTDASKYEAVLGEYEGQYRFEYMSYSRNMLSHMRDVVFDRLKDIMSAGGVSEMENIIFFDVRVDESEENGRIAQAMLDVKNEEGLPDGIENAFVVNYGVIITAVEDLAFEDDIDDIAVEDYDTSGNPKTGVVYAVLPMVAAAAAIVVLRKKK